VHAAAAVIPRVDWARPATPDADGEADGLAPADACEDPVDGVAVACGACGTSPAKSAPRIRSTVPGVRPGTCSEVTLVSCFMSVFTAGMSAVVEYSMTDLV
jgi:hypothetical protein